MIIKPLADLPKQACWGKRGENKFLKLDRHHHFKPEKTNNELLVCWEKNSDNEV